MACCCQIEWKEVTVGEKSLRGIVVQQRINTTIDKNLFYSHLSIRLSCILPPAYLLFPFFLQWLLKGIKSTHPLSFISSDAGPCLLMGQLPGPDRWKRKWTEMKTPTPSIQLLWVSYKIRFGDDQIWLAFAKVSFGDQRLKRGQCGFHRCACVLVYGEVSLHVLNDMLSSKGTHSLHSNTKLFLVEDESK